MAPSKSPGSFAMRAEISSLLLKGFFGLILNRSSKTVHISFFADRDEVQQWYSFAL